MPTPDVMQDQASCFQLVYDSGPRYVNDHCFVVDADGLVHLLHITGPVGQGCYDEGSEITFGHAVSRDLQHWEPRPDVLTVSPEHDWERDHLFAPYVLSRDDTHYLYYAGIDCQQRKESLCLALSRDWNQWSKHPCNPIFRPSRHWAEYRPGSGLWACCRDPHVLPHPELGAILYYVTWLRGTNARLVAIGAAVSDNLVTWQDAGPALMREMASDYATTSLESPCVVAREGCYYLFYKHREATRLIVSEDPLRFTDKVDTWFAVAHAAEVFAVGGRWFISSCSRDLLDLEHRTSDRTRGLFLAGLEWREEGPVVVPFTPLENTPSFPLPGQSGF